MLFKPNDVFEVRVKKQDEKGAQQFWLPMSKAQAFIETHLPIHEQNERNVWVGIAPRRKVGDSAPLNHNALWVDFDATITELKEAQDAVAKAGLPNATMYVHSGNGIHGYWKLTHTALPQDVRPYAKGLHQSLPADATHDSSRVMRVPGSMNFKTNPPHKCSILVHDSENEYDLDSFPKVTHSPRIQAEETSQIEKPLSKEDFDLFVSAWVDGQKHNVAVGVAGYLRRVLYQSKATCMSNIAKIHSAAGYDWPDENLMKVVDDTYSQMFGKVGGLSVLRQYGIVPSVRSNFDFSFTERPKPKISIIDFKKELQPQEFWASGLIGPGMLSLWAAEPKTGKSYAIMQLGYALSQGQSLWGFDVPKAVRVLYFQGELSQGMVADRAISLFGKESLQDPRQFAITDKPDEVISLIETPEVLTDLAEHYDVVIVDPIAAFNSNDENSSVTVRETMSVFDSLKAQGKAVVLVHHTKKLQAHRDGSPVTPSFSDIRGSSAWFGAADAIALQYRVGSQGNTKVKFAFRAAPEREELLLYRRKGGGFTSERNEFVAENMPATLKIPTAKLN